LPLYFFTESQAQQLKPYDPQITEIKSRFTA
jgi:hypothetical protein